MDEFNEWLADCPCPFSIVEEEETTDRISRIMLFEIDNEEEA